MREIYRKCWNCRKKFQFWFPSQSYCSTGCKTIYLKIEREKYRPKVSDALSGKQSSANVGAMVELLASAELIQHGWFVFRAITPNAPCDILTFRKNAILKVEVTVGQLNSGGQLIYNPHPKGNFDVIAVMRPDFQFTWFGKNHTELPNFPLYPPNCCQEFGLAVNP